MAVYEKSGVLNYLDTNGNKNILYPVTTTDNVDGLDAELAEKVNTSDIVDNVTSTDTNKPLSANQGKVLKGLVDAKVNTSDIVNNLTSTDTNKPLSANQGKVLKGLIDSKITVTVDQSMSDTSTNAIANKVVKSYIDTADGKKVNTADIVDNVTSTDTNKPLSANQGKVLKGLVDNIAPILRVTSPVSQTVTITNGTDTQTATGLVTNFTVYFGTWTITGGGVTKTQVVDTAKIYDVTMQIILGIKRSTTATSPAWERTDEAVGKTVSASIGSTAGHSDFDSVYPYSQITRETIGSDVLVKIPKFYYRRYQEDGYEYIKIADVAGSGFVLHPAFDRADGERDYFYVGAYKTSSNNKSVSNASPQVSQTRASMRTNAKAKGSNWGLIDIAALSAIQMLIMIEFATNDVQTAIGAGYTNASAALKTGSCDAVPNLTGRPSGTSNVVDVVWRGIEGFWGNIWEWVDGLNFNNGIYYVCTNPSNYADDTTTNYEALNYTGSSSWSSSYISQIGMDNSKAWAMMPSAASGSSSTYYCDGVWSSTNWRVFKHSGMWANGVFAGLFVLNIDNTSSNAHSSTGSRLLYLPLS